MEKLYTILLDYYCDDLQALEADYRANGAHGLVLGGSFAVYYDDQRKELAQCGYAVEGLDNQEIFEAYYNNVAQTLKENLG